MASVRVTGTYITNSPSPGPFKAFIPYPLPPDPPLNLSGEHQACQCETDEKRHVSADREINEDRIFRA